MQDLLATISDAATSPVFIVDGDGSVLHANPPAAALTGDAAEALRGRSLERLSGVRDADLGRRLARRFRRGEEGAFSTDGHSARGAAELRIVRDLLPERSLLLLGRDPEALGRLADAGRAAAAAVAARDDAVDSLSRERAERDRAEAALTESKRLFERIAELSPNMLYLYDIQERRLVYVNRAVEQAFGRPSSQIAGELDSFAAEHLHPDDVGGFTHLLDHAASLGDGACLEREFRVRLDGDEYRWLVSRDRVLSRTAAGAPKITLGVAQDITDKKSAEQERDQLLAREQLARMEAENANRAKDEFLAMLGHELRNPLAPIVTALQLMKLRGGDALFKERAILERQVKQLVQLVDDLLDVSRITRGKIHLKREIVDIADAIAQAIEMASPLLEERAHHLTVSADRPLPVLGDRRRLAQIVSNLLTNAAKYTDPGGRIGVGASAHGDAVVIQVRDSGAGIPPDLAERLFERFVQAARPLDRAQGGLGLGLSIVKSLVEIHGGTVSAESAGPGQGSLFEVRLPRAVRAAPPVEPDAQPEQPSVPTAQTARVLIVDDNRDAADSLADVLRCSGCDARAAYDGPDALAVARTFAPDLALLDIGLPVMDGYELAKKLRELAGGDRIRLIALTGYGQKSDRERSRDAGFERHLVKPIDLERVVAMVHDLGPGDGAPRAGISAHDPRWRL